MSDFEFPTPLPDDSDDVVLALKSARSLWDTADYSQAARWLRKAATAAQEAGDEQRSLELAKNAGSVESAGQSKFGVATRASHSRGRQTFGSRW